jgi:hypothetical protein
LAIEISAHGENVGVAIYEQVRSTQRKKNVGRLAARIVIAGGGKLNTKVSRRTLYMNEQS